MQDLISVIVPVFRTEKYLRRCVNSIRQQDYANLEILLVDDGSDDEAPALCDALAAEDGRIIVIHKENGGLSSSRNIGLDCAKGDYIAFVDSDDYIAPDMLSTLHDLATQYNCDVAKVDYLSVHTESHEPVPCRGELTVYSGAGVQEAFLDLAVDSVCVCLYRREAIGTLRFPVGKTSEDIPFNFDVFRRIERFIYLPAVKYYYYDNPDSISNGCLEPNKFNYLNFREEICRYYEAQDNPALTDKARALLARAAMGLLTRMALYGVDKRLDEKKCRAQLEDVFRQNREAYYKADNISRYRKILAFGITHFYPLARCMRFLFR